MTEKLTYAKVQQNIQNRQSEAKKARDEVKQIKIETEEMQNLETQIASFKCYEFSDDFLAPQKVRLAELKRKYKPKLEVIKPEPLRLSADQTASIRRLIENYNSASGREKYYRFLHLFQFLELQIPDITKHCPDLNILIEAIEEKEIFRRSLKGLAYSRGGNMAFPNYILQHLNYKQL